MPAVVLRSWNSRRCATAHPSFSDAEQVVGGDRDVVEELLAEVGFAVDLHDRLDRHARVVAEWHDEHREATVLRDVPSVRASIRPWVAMSAPEVQILEPLITHVSPSRVARSQGAGQVRSPGRLGQQLHEDLVAAQDPGQVPRLLLLRAVVEDRRRRASRSTRRSSSATRTPRPPRRTPAGARRSARRRRTPPGT